MEEKRGRKCVVFYPSPGMGHLVSMVELAKRFLPYSFNLTVVIAEPPYNTGSTASYVRCVTRTHPSINFHRLPPVSLPLDASPSNHHEATTFRFIHLNNPLLHQALQDISCRNPVSALVLDFFCYTSMEYAARLGIPPYIYFTSGATCLAIALYYPTIHRNTTASLKDMIHTDLDIPGAPPMPATHMPLPLLDREDEAYQGIVQMAMEVPKCRGILINTFQALEPRALRALSEGACVPDGPTPRVYAIGPVIAAGDGGGECLSWLDTQPAKSVVFLCFGSMGLFSAEQLKEIAIGLERSEQSFLWVVRYLPSLDDKTAGRLSAPAEPDLDALLPKGFRERTRERGMVVKSWAPQAAVLNHGSVGGFVTHCGWNSVLEAVCAGVPMVAWPLYAEQKLNKVLLTREVELAIPVTEEADGLVTAAEVDRRIRELMESEEGKRLRERTLATREAAIAAISEGGSSHSELSEFVESLKLERVCRITEP